MLTFTAFPDRQSQWGRALTMPWSAWCVYLSRERSGAKDGLAVLYGGGAARHVPRDRASIRYHSAVCLDFDGAFSIAGARDALDPWTHLIHTSHHHSECRPRFHAILPLAAPVGVGAWIRVQWGLYEMLDRRIGVSFDRWDQAHYACCTPGGWARSHTGPNWLSGSDFSEIDEGGFIEWARNRYARGFRAMPVGIAPEELARVYPKASEPMLWVLYRDASSLRRYHCALRSRCRRA